ncbi:uncharacterized protein [Pleurodeles waltl]|uniref:uncharacterized protein n=1 Tax=Pleurodeles waltl TaxID=8319 RepID=UPI0037099563
MAVPGMLLLLGCCVYISRGAPDGAEQVVNGTRGQSAFFSVGPYKDFCEWSFFGKEKTNKKGEDVIFSDGKTCPDHVYNQYRDRVEPTCNGSFLLKNIRFEDAGFYRSVCDGQPAGYYYLHVVDPVCNVSIARIPSDNGVLLYCNSTGSGVSIAWARDGRRLPESHKLTDSHTLSIPRGVACGCYQCSVLCGVLGQQYATINLTSPDYSSLIYCPLMIEILVVEGVYTAAFFVSCVLLQIPLIVCHWVLVFLSSLCFLNQEFRQDWKSVDLTPVGTVLAISLSFEVLLFIITRPDSSKTKVTRQRKQTSVCSVILWVNALLQHILVILGAAYSLADCLNLRCMDLSSMFWAHSVSIVVGPFVVVLIGAIFRPGGSVGKSPQPGSRTTMQTSKGLGGSGSATPKPGSETRMQTGKDCKLSSAKDFLKKSIQTEKEMSKLSIHKLLLDRRKVDKDGHRQMCRFGPQKHGSNDKVIMLLGATGSGKTTLINGMTNYILGVKWEDNFRFKLIDEETTRSQAESQTSSITSYHLNHQEGFQVPHSLTIIDTPGFGDTRGIDRDRFLVEQIREFFSTPGGVDHLDAVCFVVQSSLARLTPSQRYIFDSILSIFGKDVSDNILVLVTFADGRKPPVLEAIRVAEIPCPMVSGTPVHFKFNNSALFAYNGRDESTEVAEKDENFDKMFWKMGVNSLKNFFTSLNKLETKSLRLTKEVLWERKQLEVFVEGLQPQIRAGLTKQEEIRKTKAILEQNRDKMKANENFEYEITQTVVKQEVVTDFITNCQKCHQTCHYPCHIADDRRKHECSAMDENKNCRICPGGCVWSVHFNQKYRWEYVSKTEKGTYQELKTNYEKARGEVMTTEGIFQQLNEELAYVEEIVAALIDELSKCLQRLEEIALKPKPISTPEYIDLLIQAEKEEAKPGYLARMQSLTAMRERAVLIDKVSKREEVMPSSHAPPGSQKSTMRGIFQNVQNWIKRKV